MALRPKQRVHNGTGAPIWDKAFIKIPPVGTASRHADYAPVKTPRQRTRRLVDAALIACVAVGSFYATARAALAPADPMSGIAVIFPPWTSERDVFVRSADAGARFVRFGGYSFIAVVMPERADYAERARANGALMVADPKALAACLGQSILGQAR
jgi:hypothetical protein